MGSKRSLTPGFRRQGDLPITTGQNPTSKTTFCQPTYPGYRLSGVRGKRPSPSPDSTGGSQHKTGQHLCDTGFFFLNLLRRHSRGTPDWCRGPRVNGMFHSIRVTGQGRTGHWEQIRKIVVMYSPTGLSANYPGSPK